MKIYKIYKIAGFTFLVEPQPLKEKFNDWLMKGIDVVEKEELQ